MTDSCLVQKLGHHVDLSETDRELIATLEKDERHFEPGEFVRPENADVDMLYVVGDGWVHGAIDDNDGQRQILQAYVPGDIIGLQDLPFEKATLQLQTATDACLCPFPKDRLSPIFERSPSLTALLFTYSLIDHAVLLDRMKVIARKNIRDRLAHLLVVTHARLKLNDRDLGETFPFPLRQRDVADMLGMTYVSVSRAKAELQSMNLIRWHGGQVRLMDRDRLIELSDFCDRYDGLDTGWFEDLSAAGASAAS